MMEDTPRTWKDMTDAEKGALLLAHHEGKVIEFAALGRDSWVAINWSFDWIPEHAYRIKTEPVAGEVVLGGWMNSETDCYFDCEDSNLGIKHLLITLPTLDGQLITGEFTGPDGHLIKMEKTKC